MSDAPDGSPPLVLLADDDLQLLDTLTRGLERSGYRVRPAESVADAMEKVGEPPMPDVLVTDIELGDGWGATLAFEVRKLDPAIPVVYISGHAGGDPVLRHGIEKHMEFLDKPFTVDELVAAIRRVTPTEADG